MTAVLRRMRELRADRRAVTALEYGIIASALAGVLLAAFGRIATPLGQIMSGVGSSI